MHYPHKTTLEHAPAAEISDELLRKLIRREFPKIFTRLKVKWLLNSISSDSKAGKNRLSAAVLKLAQGDIAKLKLLVERCNYDFRDVVSEAEYPIYSSYGGFGKVPEDKIKEVYAADWNQYSDWINKPPFG